MARDFLTLHSRGQTTGSVQSMRGDWVVVVVRDPNGPLLGFLGQVDRWEDDSVWLSNEYDVWIPRSTIEFVHAVDGPLVGPIEFDPQRPDVEKPDPPRVLGHDQMVELQTKIDAVIEYADAWIDEDEAILARA